MGEKFSKPFEKVDAIRRQRLAHISKDFTKTRLKFWNWFSFVIVFEFCVQKSTKSFD